MALTPKQTAAALAFVVAQTDTATQWGRAVAGMQALDALGRAEVWLEMTKGFKDSEDRGEINLTDIIEHTRLRTVYKACLKETQRDTDVAEPVSESRLCVCKSKSKTSESEFDINDPEPDERGNIGEKLLTNLNTETTIMLDHMRGIDSIIEDAGNAKKVLYIKIIYAYIMGMLADHDEILDNDDLILKELKEHIMLAIGVIHLCVDNKKRFKEVVTEQLEYEAIKSTVQELYVKLMQIYNESYDGMAFVVEALEIQLNDRKTLKKLRSDSDYCVAIHQRLSNLNFQVAEIVREQSHVMA